MFWRTCTNYSMIRDDCYFMLLFICGIIYKLIRFITILLNRCLYMVLVKIIKTYRRLTMLHYLETLPLHNVCTVTVTVRNAEGVETGILVDVLNDTQNYEVIEEVCNLMSADEVIVEITFDLNDTVKSPSKD